jgi:hypothetical protein
MACGGIILPTFTSRMDSESQMKPVTPKRNQKLQSVIK